MAFGGILIVLLLGTAVAFFIRYFVPLLVIGMIGAVGAVLFIIALVRRGRAERQGRTPGKAMLVSGIVITLLSPLSAVGLFIWAYFIPK